MRMCQNNDGRIDEKFSIKEKISGDKFTQLGSIEESKLGAIEESQWQSFINELIPRGIAKLFFFDGEKIEALAEQDQSKYLIKQGIYDLLGINSIDTDCLQNSKKHNIIGKCFLYKARLDAERANIIIVT